MARHTGTAADEQGRLVRTYKGILIYLDDNARFIFRMDNAADPDEEEYGDGWFKTDTMNEAQKKIDTLLLAKVKAKKLSLSVLNGDGRRVKIVGVHGRTLRVLFTPTLEPNVARLSCDLPNIDHDTLLPDEPWVIEALRDFLELRGKIIELGKVLELISIDTTARNERGGRIYSASSTEDVAAAMVSLERNYTRAVELAKKLKTKSAALESVKKKKKSGDIETEG